MDIKIHKHLEKVLHHLYINPLEKCNLKCKICYTRKTAPILSKDQILDFVNNYQKFIDVQTITFCGGEVFALSYFPELVNTLVEQDIFIQIITNGTIDKLRLLQNPNYVNLIVSLDGLQDYHDANRGEGNFEKSINFMKKAKKLGFHLDVFSIVTKQNLNSIDSFEKYLTDQFGHLELTYHPRKPPEYLLHHPDSNIFGEVNGFDFLNTEEMMKVMKERNSFPPKDLGCYQIAVVSDGRVFGCCEGVTPIGHINDDVAFLTAQLKLRLEEWYKLNTTKSCLGCSQPEFMCGMKSYLEYFNTLHD